MSTAPSSTAFPFRVLTATLVGATVLAGCGTGGSDEGSGGEATSTGQATAASESQSRSTRPAGRVEVAPADLADFSCTRKANGRWTAEGDVTNSADKSMVYTVTVVTTDSSDQVVGERIESFELEPEQTKIFGWPKFYRGPASNCMPHVEREPA